MPLRITAKGKVKNPVDLLTQEEKDSIGYDAEQDRRGILGRPSKYHPKVFLLLADRYVKECIEDGNLVSILGFGLYCGIGTSMCHKWKDEYPEFRATIECIRETGEDQLRNKPLNSRWKENMAKFILTAKHDYKEKIDITSADTPIGMFGQAHKELSKDNT